MTKWNDHYRVASGVSFTVVINMSQGKATLSDTHQAGEGAGDGGNKSKLLCASCDSCRAKKTKCDGKRPCEACVLSYMRRHKIASSGDVDVKKVKCVYSPAKRRGPPPKRAPEKEARDQEKKQRREEGQSIAGRSQDMESAPNLNNNDLDAASVLNVLVMLLNSSASTAPAPAPPPPPPVDQTSANFQQSLLRSLGSALASQGVNMAHGVGGGASSNGGYNVVNHAPTTSQQLPYLQQLQHQLQVQQLQQNFQQQLQQTLTQQGQTTRFAESSVTSSLEEKTQALQDEVGDLRRRVNALETENASLKQQLDALQKRT